MSAGLPVAELSRRYTFSASHRLHVDALGAERNREIFGKCNNPFGHGHNYTLEVTVRGPVDATTGMVADLGALDGFVESHVLREMDHANLNCLPSFSDRVPSTENLCFELWERLAAFQGARLQHIRVEETGNNAFDYSGENTGAETRGVPGRHVEE